MSAGVALAAGRADLSTWLVPGSSHGVLLSLLFAERVTTQLDAMCVVDNAVEDRICEGWITEYWGMPHRLTGESLKCGWLIRTILFMASAFRSAVDARDAGHG